MSKNLTIVRLPAEMYLTEEDITIRAMEEGRSDSELVWAKFRLSHPFEYSLEFRKSPDWPFKPAKEKIS